ncbi:MAG TPA: NUDIX hydrolase [Gemmatimonadales bacterium]|nr:NUDIX hydrolase [Gemmatimonadales bacterium]
MPGKKVRKEVSAGGVVVRLDRDGSPRVLLIRDSYRNWGFPKGHLEDGEQADEAALREVLEETGLRGLVLVGRLQTIEWSFRFRGRAIHKTCHFFLMRTAQRRTRPQSDEGITACRWLTFDAAMSAISYANAREVLRSAREMWDECTPVVAAADGNGVTVVEQPVRAASGEGAGPVEAQSEAGDDVKGVAAAAGAPKRRRRRSRSRHKERARDASGRGSSPASARSATPASSQGGEPQAADRPAARGGS